MKSLPGWRPNLNLTADVRETQEIDFDFAAMMAAATLTSKSADCAENIDKPRFALLFKSEHQYAMGRMFLAGMEHHGQFLCEMFNQESEAMTWLDCSGVSLRQIFAESSQS